MRQRIIGFVERTLNSKRWCVFLFILGNYFLYTQIKQPLTNHTIEEKVVYIVLLSVVFYGLSAYVFITYKNIRRLRISGINTDATIIDIKESFTGNPLSVRRMLTITCTYRANNDNYIKTFRPTKEYYSKFKDDYVKENQLKVVYDPLKPQCCYPLFVVNNYLIY